MNSKFALNEELLNSISGGALPVGWEQNVDGMIQVWKTEGDEALIQKGFTPGKDGLVRLYRNLFEEVCVREGRMDDLDTILNYVETHY